jgi:patatin-related protein
MVRTVTEVRELRLALVCYGGVSLAVYMHGLTKELRKLVVASRAYERAPGANPFQAGQTEHAYYEQLAALAAGGTEVRVVIDVISGTSAGGINGVCLAQALACDGADDGLRDLWLSRGDIGGLLHAPRWLPGPLKVAAALGRLAVHPRGPYTPLRGDDMARWLYDAIHTMGSPDPALPAGGLVPAGLPLRLFVTTTDLVGSARVVDCGDGAGTLLADRDYRHVLRFSHQPGGASDFGAGGAAALALAARATSSFPGMFPPVRLRDYRDDLAVPPARACELDEIVRRYFGQYWEPSGRVAEAAWATGFVDGGVLDNAPFDHAIGAIAAQRADTEVIRNLVFIEPDPVGTPAPPGAPPVEPEPAVRPPGWLSTLWQVRTTIPWQQPLLSQVDELRELNARISDIAAIARDQMPDVERLVDAALRETAPSTVDRSTVDISAAMADGADLAWMGRAVAVLAGRARELTGLAYGTYARLRIEDAVRGLAEQVVRTMAYPPDSCQAGFARAVLTAWAQRQEVYRTLDPAALPAFLGPLDLGYRLRRLRFLGQGVNALYNTPGGPPRPAVDGIKTALYDLVDELAALPAQVLAGVPAAAEVFGPDVLTGAVPYGDPAAWAKQHAAALAALVGGYAAGLSSYAADSGTGLWQRFRELTGDWTPPQRLPLAVRYAGFPVWDTLIFPIVALSGIPQFTPIHLRRFSPLDATALRPAGAPKLKGRALDHFGGFFRREWRENDYLWGRLDGAELILGMLAGLGTGRPAAALLGRALRAVLDSEADLRTVADLRAELSTVVDKLEVSA